VKEVLCLYGPKNSNQQESIYHFSGVVENIDNLLELHRRDALCTFGTRTSVLKQLKSRDGKKAMNNDSENNSQVQ